MLLLFRVSKNVRCRRGGNSFFRQTFFVSVPKEIVGEPFNVSLISDIEKSYA